MNHTIEYREFNPDTATKEMFIKSGTLDKLINDENDHWGIWDALDDIYKIQLLVDDVFIGFITVEIAGEYEGYKMAEIHMFILPEHRRHSINVMKSIANWVFTTTDFDSIETRTFTNDNKIERVLSMVGFTHFGDIEDTHTVNGESIGSRIHILRKE